MRKAKRRRQTTTTGDAKSAPSKKRKKEEQEEEKEEEEKIEETKEKEEKKKEEEIPKGNRAPSTAAPTRRQTRRNSKENEKKAKEEEEKEGEKTTSVQRRGRKGSTITGKGDEEKENERENKKTNLKKEKDLKGKSKNKVAPNDEEEKKKEAKEANVFDSTIPNMDTDKPSKSKKFVMLGTGLDAPKSKKLRALATQLGGEVVRNFSSKVTHIVTADTTLTTRRTLKYLFGVLHGVWIVAFQWVEASLEKEKWIDEQEFEIRGDTVSSGAPKKSRMSKEKNALFKGKKFLLHGTFSPPSPSAKEIQEIIKMGGGKVVDEMPGEKKNKGKGTGKAKGRGKQNGKGKGRGKKRKRDEEEEEEEEKDEEKPDTGVIVLVDTGTKVKEAKKLLGIYGQQPVSLLWLMDSISNFKCLTQEDYYIRE